MVLPHPSQPSLTGVALWFENNEIKNYCSGNIVAFQQDLQSKPQLGWEYFRI